jgi:long-chain fatty acid transport protein
VLFRSRWTFAAGVFAPPSVITSYRDTPTAPQRYTMINFAGSVLATAGVWASFAPVPQFSIGGGFEVMTGAIHQLVALSACPATITCAPEDPDWDAYGDIHAGPFVAPTGRLGVRFAPFPFLAFGLSGSLPIWINSAATLAVRLPSEPFYDGATVSGNRASLSLTLPPIVRAGVEVRPTRDTRIEASFAWEAWTMHDQILLTPTVDAQQPNGIQLQNVRGVGTYTVGPTAIDRRFQHSFTISLGAEHDLTLPHQWHVIPRLGLTYDSSATSPAYTNVLTPDGDKFIGAIGLAVGRGIWRVEATYSHIYVPPVVADPRTARLYPTAPLRMNSQAPSYAINGGRYEMAVNTFGLGLRVSW